MDAIVFKTPPTSPRNVTPDVNRTRLKRSPTRPLSPREIPLPISPIPISRCSQQPSPSSSLDSSKQCSSHACVCRSGVGCPHSPPARPPRPPTSLPNIRPTIILSPLLVPSLPPADRPLFLKGKASFSTSSTSPGRPTFSIGTSSTWDERSYSALTPPSPCFFNSSTPKESFTSCGSASPVSLGLYQRTSSVANPPKSPRGTERHCGSHAQAKTHKRGNSSSSNSAGNYPSTNISACASRTASAASSPSNSLIRLSSPHPPSPSPYPPPTSPLPAPPSPSPLPRVQTRSKIRPRHPCSPPEKSVIDDCQPEGADYAHDQDEITPLKEEGSIYDKSLPADQPYPFAHPYYTQLHYHAQQKHYQPEVGANLPHRADCPETEGEDHNSTSDVVPRRWNSRHRKHLWMLLTAATVALLVGAVLGGVLWRLSRP